MEVAEDGINYMQVLLLTGYSGSGNDWVKTDISDKAGPNTRVRLRILNGYTGSSTFEVTTTWVEGCNSEGRLLHYECMTNTGM